MELQDYIRVLKRRKWIVIQALVVVTAAAILAAVLQTPIYSASAILLVKEQDIGSSMFGNIIPGLSLQAERGLQTQVDLIKLRPVAERVVRRLGLNMNAGELLGRTSVGVNPQSNILTVTVEDPDPATAQKLANTLADEYTAWNKDLSDRQVSIARDQLYKKLKETEKNMVSIARKVDRAGGPSRVREDIRTQWGMATTLYGMLAEKYEQLRIVQASSGADAQMVAPAVRPTVPVRPNPVRNGVLGIVLGLALGVGFAFLFEYLDNTLKTKDDVDEFVKLPVLGQVPRSELMSAEGLEYSLVTATNPQSVDAEAFRMLRSNLHYLSVDKSLSSFIVTSASPEEGKTTVAGNLAVVFARAGKKTRVLSCDLRKPVLHKLFGMDNTVGVTNVLCDKMPLSEAVRVDPKTGVEVVASGPIPPNPSELLGSRRMAEMIEQCKRECDVLILDAPPVIAVSDVLEMVPKTEGVLMVISADKTTREAAVHARGLLENVNANILGVVINNVRPEKGYGHYAYYGDGYHSTAPAEETPAASTDQAAAVRL